MKENLYPVWVPGYPKRMNESFAFRYCGRAEGEVTVRFAASNQYRVFWNGTFCGFGPMRAGHYTSYLQTLRLQPDSTGSFVLVVEVTYHGVDNYYAVREQPFFLAGIFCGGRQIAESKDFVCLELTDRECRAQRYNFQRTFCEVYHGYDRAALYRGEGNYPVHDTAGVCGNEILPAPMPLPALNRTYDFSPAETGTVTESPEEYRFTGRCVDRFSDVFQGYPPEELQTRLSDEACAFVYHPCERPADVRNAPDYVLMQTEYNRTGFLELRTEVSEPCELYLLFDETLSTEAVGSQPYGEQYQRSGALPLIFFRNSTVNVLKFTLQAGSYHLISFEPYTMKYLKIVVKKGRLHLKSVRLIAYENEVPLLPFSHPDPDVRALYDAAVRCYRQSALDTFLDCPSRERAGWMGDSYFAARGEYALTGRNEIETGFLDLYLRSIPMKRIPRDMLPMCYPCDHVDGTFIATFPVLFLRELTERRRRVGIDERERFRDRMFALLRYYQNHTGPEGYFDDPGAAKFLEYSRANDFSHEGVSTAMNFFYVEFLRHMAQEYGLESCREQADRLAKRIRAELFDREQGLFADHFRIEKGVVRPQKDFTETCQYLAFFCGIASEEEDAELYERMFVRRKPTRESLPVETLGYWKSNIFMGYLVRFVYLCETKKARQALSECLDYFGEMVRRTGTVWELEQPIASLNHGYGAVLADVIRRAVAEEREDAERA